MTVAHSYNPDSPDFDGAGAEEVVRRWWAAWQRRDLEAVEALALEDYMEYTGHSDHHLVGRLALKAVARETFERFEVTRWSISHLQTLRPSEGLAVIGYSWELAARLGDGEVRYSGSPRTCWSEPLRGGDTCRTTAASSPASMAREFAPRTVQIGRRGMSR